MYREWLGTSGIHGKGHAANPSGCRGVLYHLRHLRSIYSDFKPGMNCAGESEGGKDACAVSIPSS